MSSPGVCARSEWRSSHLASLARTAAADGGPVVILVAHFVAFSLGSVARPRAGMAQSAMQQDTTDESHIAGWQNGEVTLPFERDHEVLDTHVR